MLANLSRLSVGVNASHSANRTISSDSFIIRDVLEKMKGKNGKYELLFDKTLDDLLTKLQ